MIDLTTDAASRAFRAEVRTFAEACLPTDIRDRVAVGAPIAHEDIRRWHRILHARGWAAPGWPVHHGGTGWSVRQRLLFEEELFLADAPPLPAFGLRMIGPVLIRFGTEQQQRRFLPPILDGTHSWCQGFSEPEAGSDLAALQTRAVRRGDHWRVQGSKTWTSHAQHADWMFCLTRTDPAAKPRQSISMMLIDMRAAGVSHRPIRLMDGTPEVNQVFLDDVQVPDDQVVGELDAGWRYARFLLEHERLGIGGPGRSRHALRRLHRLLKTLGSAVDPRLAERAAELEIDLLAVQAITLRQLSAQEAGHPPGAEASLLKIRGTEIQQRITELMLEAAGPLALVIPPLEAAPGTEAVPEVTRWLGHQFLNWRKLSIYGGTNEIQRNIIARQVLGL